MFSLIKNKIASCLSKVRRSNQTISSYIYDVQLLKRVYKRKIPSLRQFFCLPSVLNSVEKFIFFTSLFLFASGLVWGVSRVSQSYGTIVPKVGGKYTEGVLGSPKLINPLFSQLNDVDEDLVKLVYSGLLRYDDERRLVSDLAVRYDVSEDAKEYIFELKQGVKWHDGEVFNSHDVVFTFDLIQDTRVGSPLFVSFQGVTVEALDAYRVKFTLTEPFPAFLSSLTVGILPSHIWNQIPVDQIRLAQRNLQPIGTGPFLFNKLVKNDTGFIYRIELLRFTDYYFTSPYIKEFALEFFSEYEGPSGLVNAMREQKIDGVNFVPFEYREKIKRKHTVLHTLQLPQYTALFFNLNHVLVQEKDVRAALGNAMDKERIVQDVLENEAKIINGPILEGFPGYDENLKYERASVDDANILLDTYFDRVSADEYRSILKERRVTELFEVQKAELKLQQQTEVVPAEAEIEASADEAPVEATHVIDTSSIDIQALETQADIELDEVLNSAQLFYRYPKGGDDKTAIMKIKLVTAATPEYAKVSEIIVGYWQDVGILVEVRLVDPRDMAREVLKTREYDVLLYGVIIGSDPDQYPFWHSDQVKYPGLNLSGYVQRGVDDILNSIRETSDPEKLNTLYIDLQKNILVDIPAVFLYTPTYTYALTDKIHGFTALRIAHPADRFAQVTEWYIHTKRVWKK